MNIEEIFGGGITVDGVFFPIARNRYRGKSRSYIIYSIYDSRPALSSDDEITDSVTYYDFHIFTDKNPLKAAKAIKRELKKHYFMWQGTSGEVFDDETGLYSVNLEFAINESEE